MKRSALLSTIIRRSVLLLILAMSTMSVWAIDLATAKAKGLVGEGNNGYLGYVVNPPSGEVKALVSDVNSKRRTIFTSTAKKNNITVEQVAHRFYERAVSATAAGRYYQNTSGNWVKK